MVPPEPAKISPVYSIQVHSEGVWCLGGTESGNVNLWSVRHEEGKIQYVFKAHKAPVSVMTLAPGEKSLLTGSWDNLVKVSSRLD